MQMFKILTTSATLILGANSVAFAQSDHGHGTQQPDIAAGSNNGRSSPMVADQHEMMQKMMPMMMSMHARMMDHGGKAGPAMMDEDMIQMMMGSGTMGAHSAEDVTAAMQMRLSEFDADEDGNLSLIEFETLHSAMVRETMVDRFQHLDADGDGMVRPPEMGAPVGRMKMRKGMGTMPMDDTQN